MSVRYRHVLPEVHPDTHRRLRAVQPVTEKSSQDSGTPLRVCCPRSVNSIPEPITRSFTVEVTRTARRALAGQELGNVQHSAGPVWRSQVAPGHCDQGRVWRFTGNVLPKGEWDERSLAGMKDQCGTLHQREERSHVHAAQEVAKLSGSGRCGVADARPMRATALMNSRSCTRPGFVNSALSSLPQVAASISMSASKWAGATPMG